MSVRIYVTHRFFQAEEKGSAPPSSAVTMAVAAQPSLRLHQNYALFRMNQRYNKTNSHLHPSHRFSRASIRASSALALEPVLLFPYSFLLFLCVLKFVSVRVNVVTGSVHGENNL